MLPAQHRCVVAVAAAPDSPHPSAWGVLRGRVPVHTRRRPLVGPGTPHAASSVYQFVLNADALLPLRRLFISFAVVAVAYYWFQVYTRVLSFDLELLLHRQRAGGQRNFGIASAWATPLRVHQRNGTRELTANWRRVTRAFRARPTDSRDGV